MSEITVSRYWWAVMYPENMVDNWESKISNLIQYPCCYIIHDKDLRKEEKEERKLHIHIIIAFPNTTTYNHALNVLSRLFASGKNAIPNNRFEACINVAHCYDYLIHNTNDCRKKKKHLYNITERIPVNNFDIGLYEQITLQQKFSIMRELSKLIRDNMIYNFDDFMCFVEDHYPDDLVYTSVCFQYSAYFERRTKAIFQKLCKKGLV